MKGKLVFKKGERARLVFNDHIDGVDATDAARALALEEKGDEAEAFLSTIEGTGKDGRITVGNVRDALEGA